MDIAKYLQAKQAGNVDLRRYGESFQAIKQKFDPDTGYETAPEISTFTENELILQKRTLEKMLASVNEMLADVQALKIAPAPKPLP